MGNNVEIKEANSISEIIIGPPPSNIITEAVMDEIIALLDKSVQNPDTRLIILTGAGVHFSYGASVSEHTPKQVDSMLPKFHLLVDKIISCPVPVLAKVSGKCLGGGFEVVIACHFIFADKTATFQVPEIKLGVFPPPASVLLPLIIGDKLTCQFTLTGGARSAEELKNTNLINEIRDNKEELQKTVDIFIAEKIMPLSASSLRMATKAARFDLIERYRKNIKIAEKLYLNE